MNVLNIDRVLRPDDVKILKQWARQHYCVGKKIPYTWHSVVKKECLLIDKEYHERQTVSTKDMG